MQKKSEHTRGYAFVAVTGILSGTIIFGGAVFADMGLSLFQIVLARSVFSLILLPYALFQDGSRLNKQTWKTIILLGVIEAFLFLSEFVPVILGVPVAVTVILLYTAPFWTVFLSRVVFKEEITVRKLIALALVLVGVVVLLNPFNISGIGNVPGIILAFVSGVFLSLWIIFGKIAGQQGITPIKTQSYSILVVCIIVAAAYPLAAYFIKDPAIISLRLDVPGVVWLYLLFFAITSSVLPQLSYYHGVKFIPASAAAIILLLEPLSGAILAALFLGQSITGNILIGGLLIIAANYLVIQAQTGKAVSTA